MAALIKNLPKPLQQCFPSNGNRGYNFAAEADCTDLLSKVTSNNNCLVNREPDMDIAIMIPAPNKAFPTTIDDQQVDTSKIFLAIPCNPDAPKNVLSDTDNLIILS